MHAHLPIPSLQNQHAESHNKAQKDSLHVRRKIGGGIIVVVIVAAASTAGACASRLRNVAGQGIEGHSPATICRSAR